MYIYFDLPYQNENEVGEIHQPHLYELACSSPLFFWRGVGDGGAREADRSSTATIEILMFLTISMPRIGFKQIYILFKV